MARSTARSPASIAAWPTRPRLASTSPLAMTTSRERYPPPNKTAATSIAIRPSRTSHTLPKRVSSSTSRSVAARTVSSQPSPMLPATSMSHATAVTAVTITASLSKPLSCASSRADSAAGAIFHRKADAPNNRNVAVNCSSRLRTSASSKEHHLLLDVEMVGALGLVAIGRDDLPGDGVPAICQWRCERHDHDCPVGRILTDRPCLDRHPACVAELHLGEIDLDAFREFQRERGRGRRDRLVRRRARRNKLGVSQRLAAGSQQQEKS